MKLWTIMSDYSATGEGRTIVGLITYAEDRDDAKKRWKEQVPEYYIDFIYEGIDSDNDLSNTLWSYSALSRAASGNCNINMLSRIHYNYS